MGAGRGERLRPLTDLIPKPLIEIAGATLIEHLIHVIKGKMNTVVVGTGWKHEMLERQLGHIDGVITQYASEWQRGPLHTLVSGLECIDANEFLICPADLVIGQDFLNRMLKAHRIYRSAIIMAVDTSVNRGTLVYLDGDNRVIAIDKTPDEYNTVASSALMVIANRNFADLCIMCSEKGLSKVGEVIKYALDKGMSISAVDVSGYPWYDVDDIETLLISNKYLLETIVPQQGSIVVHAGDVFETGDSVQYSLDGVIDSEVRVIGPAYIAKDCEIGQRCEIGPYISLGSSTTVASNSILAHCITQNTNIPRGHHEYCVIYNECKITLEG